MQCKIDELFKDFVEGKIDRVTYSESMCGIYEELTPSEKNKLRWRMDQRNLGKFALFLYDSTIRERFLVESWTNCFSDSHNIVLTNNGIDNSGRVVIDTKGANSKADYIVNIKGVEKKLEVKFGPTFKYLTYKISDLNNYIGQNNVVVLTIVGESMIGNNGNPFKSLDLTIPKGLKWMLMDTEKCKEVLEKGEKGRHFGFGFKETVRVYSNQFNIFNFYDWS